MALHFSEQKDQAGGLGDLHGLLRMMVEKGASDLHITSGTPPQMRLDGNLVALDYPCMTSRQCEQLIFQVMSDHQNEQFRARNELDFSFGMSGVGRFRTNVFRQRGSVAAAFRVIPFDVPGFEQLNLPRSVDELIRKPRGLILVTGPTGSGKSTTLAAMIDRINNEKNFHIMTIEDPIEFLHSHKNSMVNQREINSDTNNFQSALKYILRQDPDVVLIGEMRDLETVSAALTIAETGHLTLATLHTNSCVQTVNRIIDIFPAHQQLQIRAQLPFVLEGVISQQLVPRIHGGRALAVEVMIPNAAIRNLIREGKIHQIYSAMQTGRNRHGMQTMNQALYGLYEKEWITMEEALGRSGIPDELRTMISRGKLSQGHRTAAMVAERSGGMVARRQVG